MASTSLARPRRGRILGGVCLSLARRFGMRPWQMRALFLISCLLPGPQVLLYLALWVILPSE
jgi:phage shock protein PspC (stress-responsive transcriptional regulator)